MSALKLYQDMDYVFKDPEKAIEYMRKTNYQDVVMIYDINEKKAYEKTKRIYEEIKKYNEGKSLNDQILPTNPYPFRAIVGCLGVQAYEIDLGTYERNHGCVALFGGYNRDVLDTSKEDAAIIPGRKALTSLAMMGGFVR